MSTKHLRLKKAKDGYYRVTWYDDLGKQHKRSFGKARNKALNRFADFRCEWASDWHVRNPSSAGPLLIQQGWEIYQAYAQNHYRDLEGNPTGELTNIEHAMRPVLELYGDLPVTKFSPKCLKRVRETMVDSGTLSRTTVNQRINRIRRIWNWFTEEEIVEGNVSYALAQVKALARYRTDAQESDGVHPAPDDHVWLVAQHVTPTVKAMIEFQYWTGARPGEVCIMRPLDLDMTGPTWLYRPRKHKTQHLGKQRLILVGPQARKAIEPFLNRTATKPIFSPAESVEQSQDAKIETYQPKQGGFDYRKWNSYQQRLASRKGRTCGDTFTTNTYRQHIVRTCEELGIPTWTPNQLRHNAATRARKYGLDAAQAMLGHAKADVTQIYAELDMDRAKRLIERIG